MRKAIALILSISILLTLAACGRTMDDNILPNEPNELSNTSEPEAPPNVETTPDDGLSNEPGQNKSDDNNMTDNSIAVEDIKPSPNPSTSPTAISEPTPVATTEPSLTPMLTPAPTATTQPTPTPTLEFTPTPNPEPSITNISINVSGSVFSAQPYDNDTAKTFSALLPMTINMSELNGNEKYFYLADKLPTDSQQIGNINAGDLILYGSDCLVLFYESFTTSYSYTKIGYIENISGLSDAVGHDSVQVTFSTSE